MTTSEDGQRRIKDLEDAVKDLREALYGDKTYIGLLTRIKVLEERLQIFWWALGVFGSALIGVIVKVVFTKFGVE